MARALFENLNKNKNIKVDSAGIIKASGSKDLMEDLNYVFKKHNLKRKKSKQLSKELLNKSFISLNQSWLRASRVSLYSLCAITLIVIPIFTTISFIHQLDE